MHSAELAEQNKPKQSGLRRFIEDTKRLLNTPVRMPFRNP